jgi:peptidyl-prolyl cis-trans isomerase A (cyclophilin A)
MVHRIPNYRGTLAMARKTEANSGNTEFFFNLADNFQLSADDKNDGYAVFGEVVYGMEAMDEISVMPTVVSSGMKILKELVPFNVYYEKDYQKLNN